MGTCDVFKSELMWRNKAFKGILACLLPMRSCNKLSSNMPYAGLGFKIKRRKKNVVFFPYLHAFNSNKITWMKHCINQINIFLHLIVWNLTKCHRSGSILTYCKLRNFRVTSISRILHFQIICEGPNLQLVFM